MKQLMKQLKEKKLSVNYYLYLLVMLVILGKLG